MRKLNQTVERQTVINYKEKNASFIASSSTKSSDDVFLLDQS